MIVNPQALFFSYVGILVLCVLTPVIYMVVKEVVRLILGHNGTYRACPHETMIMPRDAKVERCLKLNHIPFTITEDKKHFQYRVWDDEKFIMSCT